MGRRKERRAAASVAAGRRVKLDLFAEPPPSGENNQVEGGGGGGGGLDVHDAKKNNNRVDGEEGEGEEKIPNSISSSSSGKRHDNPLLLLGQYSDEEPIDEEPTKDVSPKKASAEQMAQVEEFVARACGTMEDDMAESSAVQNIKEEESTKESTQFSAAKDSESNEIEESGSLPLNDTQKVEESTTLASDAWHSGAQIAGEVAYGWKLVMHEETNQYYYWNIETGETSWEVPAIFAQGTELGTEQKVPSVIEGSETIDPSNADASCTLHKDPVVYSSMAAGSLCNTDQVKYMNEGYTIGNVTYPELGVAIHHTELESTDVRTSLGYEGTNERPLIANDHLEAGFIISTRLVSYAESLIQKLEELGRSGFQLQGEDWISKYILEIEIRLSDFKSLLTYGSSLLPFWMHSEEKLKGLEHAINDHISQSNKTGQTNEGDTISLYRDDTTSHQIVAGDSEMKTRNQTAVPCTGNPQSPPKFDTSIIPKEAEDKSNDVDDKHILPSASPSGYIGNVIEGNTQEVNEPVLPTGLILQPVPSVVEDEDMDVDMDVDMEVDDEITTGDQRFRDNLGAKVFSPPEHSSQHDLSAEHPPSMLEEEYDVPPPPDDDWIPPPPPDAEPVPPPPPDDPPAPTNGPEAPHSETILHFPYAEQYVYPVSGSEYYGSTVTEVPNSNYYAHSEEPLAVESQAAQYYSTVPTTYSETTPVIVNPMHPSVYYDLPKETVVPVPTESCFESSGIYGESDLVSYRDTIEQTGNLGTVAKSECSSLPNVKDESVAFVSTHETETAASQIPPLLTTVQTTVVTAPVPLTNTASGAVAPSTSAAKAPTKVVRSKKRTIAVAPTLRSNKKVSSLVDKWKAAKEELHEDEEDEPQNAYELLERKRQREIEQWRAHQIATGEAKDNANFQPLGGDWRERVKRKRAQAIRRNQNKPEVPVEEKQSPDLTELSRDLPSGWQVYWDESSKTAYYGNTLTMETTWTRPTQ